MPILCRSVKFTSIGSAGEDNLPFQSTKLKNFIQTDIF